jgi:hypothetical protein
VLRCILREQAVVVAFDGLEEWDLAVSARVLYA